MEFFADILKISRVEKLRNRQGTYVLSLALTICTLFRQLINETFFNLFLKVILPFSFISKIYLDLSDTVQFLWMSVVCRGWWKTQSVLCLETLMYLLSNFTRASIIRYTHTDQFCDVS